jgi:acetylornithine/succinyldiaminopimelate/putrescine aminotransferase
LEQNQVPIRNRRELRNADRLGLSPCSITYLLTSPVARGAPRSTFGGAQLCAFIAAGECSNLEQNSAKPQCQHKRGIYQIAPQLWTRVCCASISGRGMLLALG